VRIRVLQHVAYEGPAAIGDWAAARGHDVAITRLDRGEALPAVADFDALVLMGGPMSANDETIYPWLAPEKRLVEAAAQGGRRILGVCLGSQITASALGKRVYAADAPEIGWFPVRVRAEAAASRTFAGLGTSFTPFHWHGETFDLPEGAIHLAETDPCPHQAFEMELDGGPSRGGALVLALQFHLEATEASVRAMWESDRGAAPEAALLGDRLGAHPARNRPLLDTVLDRWLAPPAEFRDRFGAAIPHRAA
jgi:GMP synthase-like glutamine amidotransferase